MNWRTTINVLRFLFCSGAPSLASRGGNSIVLAIHRFGAIALQRQRLFHLEITLSLVCLGNEITDSEHLGIVDRPSLGSPADSVGARLR